LPAELLEGFLQGHVGVGRG